MLKIHACDANLQGIIVFKKRCNNPSPDEQE